MPFALRSHFRWRLRSRSLDLGTATVVMGILNVTPDSFSDGGRYLEVEAAVARGVTMLQEGAHLLDLGGESTRPGATEVRAGEEQARVLPVIEGILRVRPEAILSIDTYHTATARLAVKAGAEIVNDVSGGLWDSDMLTTCRGLDCGVVLMHTRGRPSEWGAMPRADDVAAVVKGELTERVEDALAAGVGRHRIVVDPGFGFGKIGEENFALLLGLESLGELGFPVMVGVSRKGFLGRVVAPLRGGVIRPAEERVHETLAANVAAILGGAHILRVHDVLPGLEAAAVADAVLGRALEA